MFGYSHQFVNVRGLDLLPACQSEAWPAVPFRFVERFRSVVPTSHQMSRDRLDSGCGSAQTRPIPASATDRALRSGTASRGSPSQPSCCPRPASRAACVCCGHQPVTNALRGGAPGSDRSYPQSWGGPAVRDHQATSWSGRGPPWPRISHAWPCHPFVQVATLEPDVDTHETHGGTDGTSARGDYGTSPRTG
jgi:hypothetical protein